MQKLKKENEALAAERKATGSLEEPKKKEEKSEHEEKKEQETPGNGEEGYGWYNPVGWFGSSQTPEDIAKEEAEAKAKAEAEEAELRAKAEAEEAELKTKAETEEIKVAEEQTDEGYGWYNPVGWFTAAPEESKKEEE